MASHPSTSPSPPYPTMLSSLPMMPPLPHPTRPIPSPPLSFPLADPTWRNTLPGLPHDVRIDRGLAQVRRDGGEKMFQAIHAGLPPGGGGEEREA